MFGTTTTTAATSFIMNSGIISDVKVVASIDDGKKRTTNTLNPETDLPFMNSGECSDEVVLSFDDGKKLYVSENFLCYASPVFKAMFQHDFKENETKEVAMKGKVFDDVLELLLCLHPGVQKPIDNNNVLRVVSFAEEYQIDVSVKRCQNVMKKWLSSETESALRTNDNMSKAIHARTCLSILTTAKDCGFEELVTYAIKLIARFGHKVFTGSVKTAQAMPAYGSIFGQSMDTGLFGTPACTPANSLKTEECSIIYSAGPNAECKKLYDSLPEELKTRLLLQRLKLCDDGKMR